MTQNQSEYVIGLVADTHIPDRVKSLHPGLLPALQEAGVELILHAGDICNDAVIAELQKLAPVIAVQGNRDFLMNGKWQQNNAEVEILDVKIGLTHGHVGLWRYIYEKFEMLFKGYRFSNYARLLTKIFPEAHVIIYGHTHFPENQRVSGKLIINPGSASLGGWGRPPSFGLLRIKPGREVTGEIIPLKGAKRQNGEWVIVK